VIETHSDERGSLRIDRPWPELAAWADGLDFSKMDTTDHSHIPYVVLLVRALADWKKAVCVPTLPPTTH
jgi:amyloid beta precursor protein binding protein 1